MERVEKNRLIAAFMGHRITQGGCVVEVDRDGREWAMSAEDLKYHSSWDELIPACKKASDICQGQLRPSQHHCSKLDWLECDISIAMRGYDRPKVLNKLVAFIEHYNTTKSKEEETENE